MVVNPVNYSIQEYWRRVNALAATLPEVVTVVSVPDDRLSENQSGVVFCEVERKAAAQLLLARSHRLATEDEVAAQETKRQTDLLELARRHLASKGIVAIQLPKQNSSG